MSRQQLGVIYAKHRISKTSVQKTIDSATDREFQKYNDRVAFCQMLAGCLDTNTDIIFADGK